MYRLCRALHGKKRTSKEIDQQFEKETPRIAACFEQQGKRLGGSQRIKKQAIRGQLPHNVRPSLKRRRSD